MMWLIWRRVRTMGRRVMSVMVDTIHNLTIRAWLLMWWVRMIWIPMRELRLISVVCSS